MSRRSRTLLAVLAVLSSAVVLGAACSSTTATGPTPSRLATSGVTAGAPLPGAGTSLPSKGFASDTQTQFAKVLEDARAQFKFAGVQAGVWSPNGVWIGASGTAGSNDRRAPEIKDHTRIGSITKTFTTTLILQLVEEQKLSLEDTIDKFVPDVPNGATATIRHLATMTSGIPNYTEDDAFVTQLLANPNTEWLPNELVSIVKAKTPDFAPGKGWHYSNTNTVLLGLVIEKVTGQPVATVMRQRILVPLDLAQTSFPGDGVLPSPHLSGLTEQGQPDGVTADATTWNPSWAFTAGAMISTLDDLHTWAQALGTGKGILKPETQKLRMDSFVTDIAPTSPERGYGIGIGLDQGWLGHTGELPGFNTVAMYHPKLETTIVVMVNSDIPSGRENPAPAVFQALAKVLSQPAPDTLANLDDDLAHKNPSGTTPGTPQR